MSEEHLCARCDCEISEEEGSVLDREFDTICLDCAYELDEYEDIEEDKDDY